MRKFLIPIVAAASALAVAAPASAQYASGRRRSTSTIRTITATASATLSFAQLDAAARAAHPHRHPRDAAAPRAVVERGAQPRHRRRRTCSAGSSARRATASGRAKRAAWKTRSSTSQRRVAREANDWNRRYGQSPPLLIGEQPEQGRRAGAIRRAFSFSGPLAIGAGRPRGPLHTDQISRSRTPMAITPLMPVYPRSPVRPVRGEGVYLYGEQGEKYLDFAGGHRGQHPRPWPPASDQGDPGPGGDADARVQPLRLAAGRSVRQAAVRPDLRRHGVLHQFGRRGGRVRDQDRAALPLRQGQSRTSTT